MAFRVLASLSMLWRLSSRDFTAKLPKITSNMPALKPRLYINQLAALAVSLSRKEGALWLDKNQGACPVAKSLTELLLDSSKIAGIASQNISSNTQKHSIKNSTNTTINSILSHKTFPNAKSLWAANPSSLGFLFRHKRVAKNSKQAQSKTTQSSPPYTIGPPHISSRSAKPSAKWVSPSISVWNIRVRMLSSTISL